MKSFYEIRRLQLIVLLLMGWSFIACTAQQNQKDLAKAAEVKKMLEAKKYRFKVQSVQPMRGGNINVTSDYDLVVKKDTLICYLPYFGRAYTAPINPTESGLSFTSTAFEYTVEDRKKGQKYIYIRPEDKPYARQFQLNISTSGYGTLQVTSNYRDPISYNGYIEPLD